MLATRRALALALLILIAVSHVQNVKASKQLPVQSIGLGESAPAVANFTTLDQHLQSLHDNFVTLFLQAYPASRLPLLTPAETGEFLFLLGKTHLYGMAPELGHLGQHMPQDARANASGLSEGGRYLLGYYYIKVAAEKYSQPDAYYYLAVLEYIKLTPTLLIKSNMRRAATVLGSRNGASRRLLKMLDKSSASADDYSRVSEMTETLESIAYDMESHHLHNTEHNLYLASVLGQTPARQTLAYLFKHGISVEKNCSSALAYYLSVVKKTKVDIFEYPLEYSDQSSFQKELYAGRRAQLGNYGEQDYSILLETEVFDEDSFREYEVIAMNYLTGENGFRIDEKKALQMYMKIKDRSRDARIMLALMHLKGRGVEKDVNKARHFFELEEGMGTGGAIVRENILLMKYLDMGYKNEKKGSLEKMQKMFTEYESYLNATNSSQLTERVHKIRTPVMKYFIGSLVLADQIKGNKSNAIFLIDEAAKQGNTLALTMMGLLKADGSDSSFSCERSTSYFATQTLSHKVFQQKVELAKLAIKNEMHMYAFIKYVQLMMVGYKNAFINALYLVEVYGRDLFRFDAGSWSSAEVRKNPLYRHLLQLEIVPRIQEQLLSIFLPVGESLLSSRHIDYLTSIQAEPTNESAALEDGQYRAPVQIQEYVNYTLTKILQIGIAKHEISILKFFKYRKSGDIALLHQLANIGENSEHIYQSRFLLGRYYQHTPLPSTPEERRHARAKEEYTRATKNKFLADLIYFIEGGTLKDADRLLSHFLWYLTALILAGLGLYWKKNKVLEERLAQEDSIEQRRHQAETHRDGSAEQQKEDEEKKQQEQRNRSLGEIIQGRLKEEEEKLSEFGKPKFSEEQEQNIKYRQNLMNIGEFIDQRERKKNSQQYCQDQPIIIDDEPPQHEKNI